MLLVLKMEWGHEPKNTALEPGKKQGNRVCPEASRESLSLPAGWLQPNEPDFRFLSLQNYKRITVFLNHKFVVIYSNNNKISIKQDLVFF